mmetsp:Transcript_66679/g.180282  ORF Transcript_66679/g.180282 Transcript_66679/m.180282 type:complete len:280 (-) Transcript_66679:451-1290(-)
MPSETRMKRTWMWPSVSILTSSRLASFRLMLAIRGALFLNLVLMSATTDSLRSPSSIMKSQLVAPFRLALSAISIKSSSMPTCSAIAADTTDATVPLLSVSPSFAKPAFWISSSPSISWPRSGRQHSDLSAACSVQDSCSHRPPSHSLVPAGHVPGKCSQESRYVQQVSLSLSSLQSAFTQSTSLERYTKDLPEGQLDLRSSQLAASTQHFSASASPHGSELHQRVLALWLSTWFPLHVIVLQEAPTSQHVPRSFSSQTLLLQSLPAESFFGFRPCGHV